MCVAMMISGLVIAYAKGWKLSLVITAYLPVMVIMGAIYVTILQNK
jgi:hypothetical protein